MTKDKFVLYAQLEKVSDTSMQPEMIGFSAERLMVLEADTLRGAAPSE